jgi:ketosteroid isomerase-like protein/ribosomal protein L40E
MVVCPKCNIEYDTEKKFCRKCGSFLLTEGELGVGFEGVNPAGRERTSLKLFCPKCQLLYKTGNYCRKCGSLLVQGSPFQRSSGQPLEKKLIRRWSKEWLRISKERKKLEACLDKLEKEKDKVSSDIVNPMFARYQEELESLSSLHKEIEAELESVKKKVSEEIDLLEKGLKPIQKRFQEVQYLYQSGAMTKADYSREKNEKEKEIEPRERNLRKYQQITSLLPSKMGGQMPSFGIARGLLQPLPLMVAGGIIIPLALGGYSLWQNSSQSGRPIPKEIVTASSAIPSSQSLPPAAESEELKKIKVLFENIRQANLKKNISLFMSCYSHDFEDKKGKRLAALETWENFNYLGLSYDLKKQTITGDTADVSLEWLIRISPKAGGDPQDSRSVLNVTLRKEGGDWKIKEIKSVS